MLLFLVSLFLPFSSADILSDHLTHNVDVSVNPCDDFYLHLCSQTVDREDFPYLKISKFYQQLVEKHDNISKSGIASIMSKQKQNEHLTYFASKLYRSSTEEILNVLPSIVEWFYNSNTHFAGPTKTAQANSLKSWHLLINVEEDTKELKKLIIAKFRSTPWLNQKDDLGLTWLTEFEDKMNDLQVYYDLDNYDRDVELLKKLNDKYIKLYYLYRERSTGVEIIDIFFSIRSVILECAQIADVEEAIMVRLLIRSFSLGGTYYSDLNKITVRAPFLHPALTDNFNKPYNFFFVIGHEIFHSVVITKWATRSSAFKNGMECLADHYNRTCDSFGTGSCNSGAQTFTEDGCDVEGQRINYDFFSRKYNEEEMKEAVFQSESLTVNREQAFFYLTGINFCGIMNTEVNHTNVHSLDHVRLNGLVTQMPEFSKVFSCSPDQAMFTTKEQTCNLFGPDAR